MDVVRKREELFEKGKKLRLELEKEANELTLEDKVRLTEKIRAIPPWETR